LQELQVLAVQPLQELPDEEMKRPPLLVPKRENFFSTFRLRQEGQLTLAADAGTILSNSSPHFRQANS